MRISHLADIHWRSLSRHDEYRYVFTEFVQQLKDKHVEHVFIAGDLFHTKTSGMSPECIDQMSWWLKVMADVCPVHIILGNHDYNQINKTRQDAISPIVNVLNHHNVHLYKNSGVYQFAPGYNWCVYSIFDEENWDIVKPVAGDVNIACYHGPVWGATSETGWDVGGDMTVGFFKDKGYQFAFLGDIHHRQFLDFRESELIIDESELGSYLGAEVLEEIDDQAS